MAVENLLNYLYLDLTLLFFGEHTEHESSEQLLNELPEADLLPVTLLRGGERGLPGLGDLRTEGVDLRLVAGDGGERLRGVLRPIGERRGNGERGDLRPTGDLREGGLRGDLRPINERERLRRLGDGEEEPSRYIDL